MTFITLCYPSIMPIKNEKNAWDRFRDREDEREKEALKKASSALPRGSVPGGLLDPITQLLQQVDPLIDQVNSLYNQYLGGIEKTPPLELRKQLEKSMDALQKMPKATQSTQFRCNSIQSRFQTHRERWDKMMLDLEKGKIKRRMIKKK